MLLGLTFKLCWHIKVFRHSLTHLDGAVGLKGYGLDEGNKDELLMKYTKGILLGRKGFWVAMS